jgi:hypothetical protein
MNFLPNPSADYNQYNGLSSGGVGSVATLYALDKLGILPQGQTNANKNSIPGQLLYKYLNTPGVAPPFQEPIAPTSIATQIPSKTQVSEIDNDIIDQSLPNFANALASAMA